MVILTGSLHFNKLSLNDNKLLTQEQIDSIYYWISHYYVTKNFSTIITKMFLSKLCLLVSNTDDQLTDIREYLLNGLNSRELNLCEYNLEKFDKFLKNEFKKFDNIQEFFNEKFNEFSQEIMINSENIFPAMDIIMSHNMRLPYVSALYENKDISTGFFGFINSIISYICENRIKPKIKLKYVKDIDKTINLPELLIFQYNYFSTRTIVMGGSFQRILYSASVLRILSKMNLCHYTFIFDFPVMFNSISFATENYTKFFMINREYYLYKSTNSVCTFLKKEYSFWKKELINNIDLDKILRVFSKSFHMFVNNSTTPDTFITKKEFNLIIKKNKTDEDKLYLALKYNFDI